MLAVLVKWKGKIWGLSFICLWCSEEKGKMFIKSDMFDKLLCCRRKVVDEDEDERVVEEVVLQHTNNNKTEYISSAQLVEVIYDPQLVSGYFRVGRHPSLSIVQFNSSGIYRLFPPTTLCYLSLFHSFIYSHYFIPLLPLPSFTSYSLLFLISPKHILW